MARVRNKKSKYRSALEDKIVPGALARHAAYEPITLPYTAEHRYKPDLVLTNGIVIEIKGWFTPEDRAKTLRVLKAYPGLELRFVMQRPETTLNARSKTTNAMWLDAHGIKWAKRTIPDSWYTERPFMASLRIVADAQRVKSSRKVAA